MLLYTPKNDGYENLADRLQREPLRKTNVYVNLTNQCTCACTFCLRNTKEIQEFNSLWLKTRAFCTGSHSRICKI